MPGSGKSSAGRSLAQRFSYVFLDTDSILEQELAMPVSVFFRTYGEDAFRDAETQLLQHLAARPHPAGQRIVLSTGGGSILRPQNRELLRHSGLVVYLAVKPFELYRRLRGDTKRPLLQVPNPRGKLQELYQQRDPLYRETAHITLHAGQLHMRVLADRLAMQMDMLELSHAV